MPSASKADDSAVQVYSTIHNTHVHMSKANHFFVTVMLFFSVGLPLGVVVSLPFLNNAKHYDAPHRCFRSMPMFDSPLKLQETNPFIGVGIEFSFVCLRHCRMLLNAAMVTRATNMGILRLDVLCRATSSLSAP